MLNMSKPQVSVFLGLSLDGYIARDDFSIDWLDMVLTDPPEDAGFTPFMASVDAIIMGRNTYDSVLEMSPWPYTGKKMVVLTTRAARSRHGETFFAGSLSSLIENLGKEGFKRIYLDGGVTVQQGLAEGLVDDLTLSWLPIVLGKGRALFDRSLPESRWTLTSSRVFPSGLLQATYQRK
jgi:dihydrofolate reductase